jgi:hypothetical protein
MDDEVFIAMVLCYRTEETELDGNKLCPSNVATARSPTITKLNRFPVPIKYDPNTPVCGGVDPTTN